MCNLCSYITISSNLTSISGWTRRTHSELFSSKYVLFQFLPRISFLSGYKESSILVRHNRIGFCSRCVQYWWDPRKRSGEILRTVNWWSPLKLLNQPWWELFTTRPREDGDGRPISLTVWRATRAIIRNFRIESPPFWSNAVAESQDVTYDGMLVNASNTDPQFAGRE